MRSAVASSMVGRAISGGTLSNASTGKIRREHIHRNIHQYRSRPAGLREMERAFHNARQILHAIHAIDALAKRPIHLALIGIGVQVDFLMRMAAVVATGNIAGEHHHRHRVQSGGRNAGGRICQSWTQMAENHSDFAGRARVTIGGMRGDLFVTSGDEADTALAEGVQQRDDSVAAKAENDLDSQTFEIFG